MNRLMKIGLFAFLIFPIGYSELPRNNKVPIKNFGKLINKVPAYSILEENGYYVWGGSVVKGPDNLYHMFYSRSCFVRVHVFR